MDDLDAARHRNVRKMSHALEVLQTGDENFTSLCLSVAFVAGSIEGYPNDGSVS